MAKIFEVKVEGLKDVDKFLTHLPDTLTATLYAGIRKYVKKDLVARIHKRLLQAASAHSYSPNHKGIGSASGGYGLPKNHPRYKEWKESRANLPLVGSVSVREMVATGHFLESIDLFKVSGSAKEYMEFHIGPTPGVRSAATPMSDDGSGGAKTDRLIENTQLAEWLEDSQYRFWAIEYEDVIRDVTPLILRLIKLAVFKVTRKMVIPSKGI